MIIAHCALHPENRIENPLFVSVRYGDDSPCFCVIDRDLIREYGMAWGESGATAELIDPESAMIMIERGAWFGIKIATAGNIAAWGHARVIVLPVCEVQS